MAVNRFLRELEGLFNYSTDENPTTQQDYQEAVKNWVNTIINLVDCTMWQPNTEYEVGNVLRTPSLPLQLQLTCTTAGTSGSAEPDYTDVEAGDVITDGTAEFRVDYSRVEGALASTNDIPSGVTFGSTTLLSKMIANMNPEDGVRYNFNNSNAWYICLGAKYGGLIIQGGIDRANTTGDTRATFPISFTSAPLIIPGFNGNVASNLNYSSFTYDRTTTGFKFGVGTGSGYANWYVGWIAFGS